MTIRDATAADLAAIMALERASFPSDAWSEAMMRDELTSSHGRYIVDVEGARVIGYAGLRAPTGARDADIQTIAIADAARGRGRGRALLGELLAEADRRRVSDVFLEVRADNPVACALYASEGFREVGRRPRYYQPDDVDAVVMRLDLPAWRRAHREEASATAEGFEEASVAAPSGDAPVPAAAGPAPAPAVAEEIADAEDVGPGSTPPHARSPLVAPSHRATHGAGMLP